MTIIELHSQVSNWFLWICFPIDIALKFECISRSILDGKIILEKIVFSTNSEKNDGALHNRYLDTHTDSSTLFQVWFTVQAVRADKSICEGFLLRLSTLKWGYFMLLSHRESELCKQLPPSTCARSSETEFFPSWRRVGNNSRSWFFSAVSSPAEQWGCSEARVIRLRWPGRMNTDWISQDFPRRCSRCALLWCLTGQGSLSSRLCISCTRGLFSLLKCTYLRRWKDCRWVFWLFLCLCVSFSFFCCSFPGACIMTATIHTIITISMNLNFSVLFMFLLQSSR